MTPTHQIVLAIAERIRAACPREADKLLFVASEVQWMERRVNELVADEIAATRVARMEQR